MFSIVVTLRRARWVDIRARPKVKRQKKPLTPSVTTQWTFPTVPRICLDSATNMAITTSV